MIIATIKKLDGTYLDHGSFQSEEAAMEWFQPFINSGVYGQKHIPAHEVPAVLDLDGVETSPAYVVEEIPAAFSIEFVDNSAQLAQEQTNKAAREFLNSSDFKILRHLRQQHLEIATTLTAQEFSELEQERQMAADSIV